MGTGWRSNRDAPPLRRLWLLAWGGTMEWLPEWLTLMLTLIDMLTPPMASVYAVAAPRAFSHDTVTEECGH